MHDRVDANGGRARLRTVELPRTFWAGWLAFPAREAGWPQDGTVSAAIRHDIGRTFDLEVILRQVIGPRLALGDAFRRYTIASYVANFDTYSGQRFEVAPVVRAAGSDRVVETQIAAASGQGYVLDYVMRQESGGWKVVDVLADGAISRVAAQRSEMRSLLADSGGAGLLVGQRQKTADLSGGILQ